MKKRYEKIYFWVCLVGWIVAFIFAGLYIRTVWDVANYKKLVAAAEASNRQLEKQITELRNINNRAEEELARARETAKKIAGATDKLAKKISGGLNDLRTIDETNKRLTEIVNLLDGPIGR